MTTRNIRNSFFLGVFSDILNVAAITQLFKLEVWEHEQMPFVETSRVDVYDTDDSYICDKVSGYVEIVSKLGAFTITYTEWLSYTAGDAANTLEHESKDDYEINYVIVVDEDDDELSESDLIEICKTNLSRTLFSDIDYSILGIA